MSEPSRVVATDASVLINLIHVGQLDLLGHLERWRFVVPNQVAEEIIRPEQRTALAEAASRPSLRREASTHPEELQRFAEFRRLRLDRGEASCLAMAVQRGWVVASDERGRFLRIARERVGAGRLLNTPGILLLAIRHDVISVDDADRIKAVLETMRFRMRFRSFRDLIGNP
ncbi:MAG: hypothetical protein AB1726_16625 [Planctomycetota bacterium]